MKTQLSEDYFAGCLRRLEEFRGRVFSEGEYRALRRELLEELASARHIRTRRLSLPLIAGCGTAAGIAAAFAVVAGWWWLVAALVWAFALLSQQLRLAQDPPFSREDRRALLDSLLHQRLVTVEEFSDFLSRIELQRAA